MERYKHKTVGTKVLTTEIEFASPDGGLDTEVRITEATTLCWISGQDVDKFTEALQAVIDQYAI